MITPYLVHDATGRILRTGQCPQEMVQLQAMDGNTALEGQASDLTDYVSNGVVLPRPVNPATLSGLQLQNVPLPAALWFDGATYALTESTVDLTFDAPGAHVLTLQAFPYLDKTFTVTT
jgi:hypothetical protein